MGLVFLVLLLLLLWWWFYSAGDFVLLMFLFAGWCFGVCVLVFLLCWWFVVLVTLFLFVFAWSCCYAGDFVLVCLRAFLLCWHLLLCWVGWADCLVKFPRATAEVYPLMFVWLSDHPTINERKTHCSCHQVGWAAAFGVKFCSCRALGISFRWSGTLCPFPRATRSGITPLLLLVKQLSNENCKCHTWCIYKPSIFVINHHKPSFTRVLDNP